MERDKNSKLLRWLQLPTATATDFYSYQLFPCERVLSEQKGNALYYMGEGTLRVIIATTWCGLVLP